MNSPTFALRLIFSFILAFKPCMEYAKSCCILKFSHIISSDMGTILLSLY